MKTAKSHVVRGRWYCLGFSIVVFTLLPHFAASSKTHFSLTSFLLLALVALQESLPSLSSEFVVWYASYAILPAATIWYLVELLPIVLNETGLTDLFI